MKSPSSASAIRQNFFISLRLFPAFVSVTVALAGCAKKEPGFGVEGSSFRFQTTQFEDAKILAKVGDLTFNAEQVFERSPVLKDLEQQQQDATLGLVYLKALSRVPENSDKISVLKLYGTPSQPNMAALLQRFGKEPSPAIEVEFLSPYDSTTLGQLGGEVIHTADIDFNHFVFQSIQQRRLREMVQLLSGQITRLLLAQEAQKAGLNLQDHLAKNIFTGEVSVSADEFNAYTKSISLAESEITEDLRARLMAAMREKKEFKLMEEYVAKKLISGPIAVAFTPPQAKLQLSGEFHTLAGYDDAPVSMVAFSGVACPDCVEAIQTVNRAIEKFDGHIKVNWVFQFDPSSGTDALMAQSALCLESQKQGFSLSLLNRFAFEAGQIDENIMSGWVIEKGLDGESFKKCLVQGDNAKLLEQHLLYAKSVGVIANPTLWIDGVMIEGAVREGDVIKTLERMIKDHGESDFTIFVRRWKRKIKAWF